MKKKLVIIVAVIYSLFTLTVWIYPKQEESLEERRKLKQRPTLNIQTILSHEFTDNFETYAQDQFPFRFQSRQAKAFFRYYGLALFENNQYVKDHGSIIHLESTLNEKEIVKAAQLFQDLNDRFFSERKVYVSIIPDKSYYSSKNLVTMDYGQMEDLLLSNMMGAQYINIKDSLTLGDFYKSDIHWKQEKLLETSNIILEAMGKDKHEVYSQELVDSSFKGVYYGHSALAVGDDEITSILSDTFDLLTVSSLDSNNLLVHNKENLKSKDKYDYFLEGPQAILTLENPQTKSDDELIIFRDSFASSITPYFIEDYKSITLIDLRYISSSILEDYVDFEGKDVLFLYSGTVLNSSSMLKK